QTDGPINCSLGPDAPGLVGATLVLEVSGCQGAAPFSYSWNFGDGSPSTDFSDSTSTSHSYADADHYPVILTAQDSLGRRANFTRRQTVIYALTPGQPRRSSPIVYDELRQLVSVVNPDSNTVTAIDAQTYLKAFEARVGKHPRTLAPSGDGNLWVVNQDEATIQIIDGQTGAPVAMIGLPFASRPYGIAFEPGGSQAYVTLEATGRLLRIDPATRSITADVDVGPTPRGIAISGDAQRIFVTRFISPSTPGGDDRGEVRELAFGDLALTNLFQLAIDPGPDTESSGRGIPNYISSLTLSPDGRRAWVPSKKDNTLRGQYRDGQSLTFESTVRTVFSQLDLQNNVEILAARRDINNADMANAVAFNALGHYAFVATQGTNRIAIHDGLTGAPVSAIDDVGLAPQGLVFVPAGQRLFIHNFMSRDVAVYDISDVGWGNVFPRLALVATVSEELLAPQVLRGKQIFYNAADLRMARDGYLSCASCHLDGNEDGRVWDFTDRGEGFRNTISLLGRKGIGHGRVHWTANFDEIQDFENDIRNAFGGTGFMSDAQFFSGTRRDPLGDPKAGLSRELDALSAYVSSLTKVSVSPYRNADGSLSADGQAGRLIFQGLSCASCHSGPELTDSATEALHDVGTIKPSSGQRRGEPLTGFDTPTLKGIWETAPYLHDGSAPTLLDVLTTANPAGLHGDASSLSDVQLSQLVAYLLQIDDIESPSLAAEVTFVSTGRRYQEGRAQVGHEYFIDRAFAISSLSPGLKGSLLVLTASDDKACTTVSDLP